MKILQINTTVNSGSTGRIAEDIGQTVIAAGHQSYIAATKTNRPSQSEVIYIGTVLDRNLHGLKTRLFDRHGFGSALATLRLIKKINTIDPDIIHLHNIHGYYINVKILFDYLKAVQKPVIWTLHDCWSFTGHCSHFEGVNCYKWKNECHYCSNQKGYPASWFLDNSRKNFNDKKRIFNGLKHLYIVTPSHWLANHVKSSFLKGYPVQVIHNGVDLNTFKPVEEDKILKKYGIPNKKIILGVANTWKKRKALNDLIQLSSLNSGDKQIVLVGLTKNQIKKLPENIIGIPHTENAKELAAFYSAVSVFVNPTRVDNFPTTNIEALACGTPVVTYNTGGSPEAIDEDTGIVVEKGDLNGLVTAIQEIISKGKEHYQPICRARAKKYYNKDERYVDYLNIYNNL